MEEYLIQITWFFLPAGFANMAPVLFKWIPLLDLPVDNNLKIKDKLIFGPHKTYRGFFFAILLALLVINLQRILYPVMKNYSIINYEIVNIWLLGFLMGFGALFGDLVRSFIKRRFNIPPGKLWFPWDQLDWVVGTILFTQWYVKIPWSIILTALVLSLIIHPLVNYLGYLLKMKHNKF